MRQMLYKLRQDGMRQKVFLGKSKPSKNTINFTRTGIAKTCIMAKLNYLAAVDFKYCDLVSVAFEASSPIAILISVTLSNMLLQANPASRSVCLLQEERN